MNEKTALITGATSGIGAAYAKLFAQGGYNLIITGRRSEIINSLADELRTKFQINVEVFIGELSEQAVLDDLISKIKAINIDVLINNAGFGYYELFYKCDFEILNQMVNVHQIVPMKLIQAVLPKMLEKNSGTIINVSSEGAFLVTPKNSVYCASKAFLINLTESLKLELFNTDIKVQVLCPGLTRSDFHTKMGMDSSKKKNKGLISWMDPDKVAATSLKYILKNKVICIPGLHNRFLIMVMWLLPKKLYYKVLFNFSNKRFNRK